MHIHRLFNLTEFLNSAYSNFQSEALRWNRGNDFIGVLCLVDTDDNRSFNRLVSLANQGHSDRDAWSFHSTGETNSIYAESPRQGGLYLIAGRQMVTKENLELLAIGVNDGFIKKSSIRNLIDDVIDCGGIPVIPWGGGKWTGKRARILEGVIGTKTSFFLGDNSGRWESLPYPKHFTLALNRGIKIIPGSDPLPFVSEVDRAGSFGFIIEATISSDRPADGLKQLLCEPGIRYRSYGRFETGYRFIKHQLGMQILKRIKKGEQKS